MVRSHTLGFPRIGAHRELKFALESYWHGDTDATALEQVATHLRQQNWRRQANCDLVPVGDFSLYDQVLDMSFLLGNVPQRAINLDSTALDNYFRVARGRSVGDANSICTHAGEMTKWFDTNYHYIVPELCATTNFSLHAENLLAQIKQANEQGINAKPVIIGPLTYLRLAKATDNTNPLSLLPGLLPTYQALLKALHNAKCDWIQIDEPILVTELDEHWRNAFRFTYEALAKSPAKLLLTTYFGELQDNLELACELPVAGLHLDAINAAHEIEAAIELLGPAKILSLGVINGRNIWRTNLDATLDRLEPIYKILQERLWLAPSCSLLHVPVDLASEQKLDSEISSWLAFAQQKLEELETLKSALNNGRHTVQEQLLSNRAALEKKQQSRRVINPTVREAVASIKPAMSCRKSGYEQRIGMQRARLKLPDYPTTTIGSFPQTQEIRKSRLAFKKGELPADDYQQLMQQEIEFAIREQEALGLDVLVHGEAERNDMVEYFGEQLDGFAFSQFGWVQSYGSRCVKPPILFGDVSRPKAMTVDWLDYARSLTDKPMKGMLTGPVTILNWSFVRDDQPHSTTCQQIALAIRTEVLDLEAIGLPIIQIDEAALREGLPLRHAQWREYLEWAVECFRLCANSVKDETQIHTHMCYSEFNDILDAIAQMDADVITIETSRSNMELLTAFEEFRYPNEIGPGVYDIHSPNTPSEAAIVALMREAEKRIPAQRLWVNPDCGLKTRRWEEVVPALRAMVSATKQLRQREESEITRKRIASAQEGTQHIFNRSATPGR